MTHLERLENESIFIIREAFFKFKNPALLWSMGKDSTTLLWLVRKAFLGKIPFPVMHVDTSYKFPEIYDFRDRFSKEWNLDLRIVKNEDVLNTEGWPKGGTKLSCCSYLKTDALKQGIEKYNFDCLYLGIRRDEHGIRAKERVFSPRTSNSNWNYQNQPAELWNQYSSKQETGTHYRIHPLLHMTELEIWQYIQKENMPVCDLYFSKEGKRYRSIGCAPCCEPIQSEAKTVEDIVKELKNTNTAERDGRAQDKEDANTMQKLRSLGYM